MIMMDWASYFWWWFYRMATWSLFCSATARLARHGTRSMLFHIGKLKGSRKMCTFNCDLLLLRSQTVIWIWFKQTLHCLVLSEHINHDNFFVGFPLWKPLNFLVLINMCFISLESFYTCCSRKSRLPMLFLLPAIKLFMCGSSVFY